MQEKLNCKPYGWIIEQRWSYKVGNGNGIYEERMINWQCMNKKIYLTNESVEEAFKALSESKIHNNNSIKSEFRIIPLYK